MQKELKSLWDTCVTFHGHGCGGLAVGFRAVLYADERVRAAALLHDVGKPFCMKRDGNAFLHPEEGERIAGEILARFRAPKKETTEIKALVRLHMYDFDGKVREGKLRRFFVLRFAPLEKLMLLKQADYSGCKDDLSVCPTNLKWEALLQKMRAEGAPLKKSELAVSGGDLKDAGIPPSSISLVLDELLLQCALCPALNRKEKLLSLARGKKYGADGK